LDPFIVDSSARLELLAGHIERHWKLLQVRLCQRNGSCFVLGQGKQPFQCFHATNQATTTNDKSLQAVLNGECFWPCIGPIKMASLADLKRLVNVPRFAIFPLCCVKAC
jgi:hypothetical protein